MESVMSRHKLKVGQAVSSGPFDYSASAELFLSKRKGGARPPPGYRRFATAMEGIRFVVEDFPAIRTLVDSKPLLVERRRAL